MAGWDEVRQLAADFQQLQKSTGAHRLSERNCIELVTRLISAGRIQVVYTLDGKEYVTPQQVEREIRNELLAHRGRINVVNLQAIMNVDLSHIETKVSEILKHDRSITLLHGELITRNYLHGMCEEISDALHEIGQMSVAELSKNFSLPNSFLLEVIESSLGTKILGYLDKTGSGTLYTEAYIKRYQSRIRGLFSAITCPVPISPILAQGQFQERLFFSVLHKLISSGDVCGTQHGHGTKSVYTPRVYVQMQHKWADAFFQSNGYIEFDALRRLGVEDPQGYASKYICNSSEGVVERTSTCMVGEIFIKELEGEVEDLQSSGSGWLDCKLFLPSVCTTEDVETLLQSKYGGCSDVVLFGRFLTTPRFMESCTELFAPLIKERALKTASVHPTKVSEYVQGMSEADSSGTRGGRKKAGKVKKLAKGKERSRLYVEFGLEFMSTGEIFKLLRDDLVQCDDLCECIALHIERSLQSDFLKETVSCLSLGSAPNEQRSSQQRKCHSNLQQKIEGMWSTAGLFSQAIGHFEGSAAVQLSRYLLRTLCSDLTNLMLVYLAEDCGLQSNLEDLAVPKERLAIISKLPALMTSALSSVNAALNGKDVNAFFELYMKLCAEEYCGFMLKKLDKKKERQLIYSHQQSLKKKLAEEEDYAMSIHLIIVLLFYQHTGSIIHIPGKFVPNMIVFLSGRIPEKVRAQLVDCQQLVTTHWRLSKAVSCPGIDDAGKPSDNADSSNATDPERVIQLSEAHEDLSAPAEIDDVETRLIVLVQELKHLVM